MVETLSRTKKKQQAKEIENLSRELTELPPSELARLPCDDFLRDEIRQVKKLKGGSRKRQIKYIARELRQQPVAPLLDFLAERRGSRLKAKMEIRELENIRDQIVQEALEVYGNREDQFAYFTINHPLPALARAAAAFPGLDQDSVLRSAERFAVTRRPGAGREIFRLLKAAAERKRFGG